MADHSKIEWTDATFNPWIGCTKVSPACDHCYAAVSTPSRTLGIQWGAGQSRHRTSPANWKLPLLWNKQDNYFQCRCGLRGEFREFATHPDCLLTPVRRRVFCASLADVFDNEVDPLWRRDLFGLIRATPNLDWLLLTKRIGNVVRMLDDQWGKYARDYAEWSFTKSWVEGEPPSNVRLGATICNQPEADRDISKLLAVPAVSHFVSVEPMLGPINFRWAPYAHEAEGISYRQYLDKYGSTNEYEALRKLDWVIAGGESGHGARPMHPDWARSLRDQCASAGVPFFFKQWGEFDLSYDRDRDDPDFRSCDQQARLPGRWVNLAGGHGFHGDRVHYAHKVGKRAAGRLLDGVEHNAYPEVGE